MGARVLVRVHAASINPADWKTAQGECCTLIDWPGVFDSISGVVVAVGGVSGDTVSGCGSDGESLFVSVIPCLA